MAKVSGLDKRAQELDAALRLAHDTIAQLRLDHQLQQQTWEESTA